MARFDGLKFTVFDHVNTPELANDECCSLTEDSEDNLWVATGDGLVRIRGRQFTHFAIRYGLRQVNRSPLCTRHSGGVWAGGNDSISHIHDRDITTYAEERGFPNTQAWVMALEEDEQGGLWLATFEGLIRFDTNTQRYFPPRYLGGYNFKTRSKNLWG